MCISLLQLIVHVQNSNLMLIGYAGHMGKRQKCMRNMLYKNSASDNTPLIHMTSSSKGCISSPCLTPLEIVVSQWNDA